jgi:hypothetical protein
LDIGGRCCGSDVGESYVNFFAIVTTTSNSPRADKLVIDTMAAKANPTTFSESELIEVSELDSSTSWKWPFRFVVALCSLLFREVRGRRGRLSYRNSGQRVSAERTCHLVQLI